LDTLASTGLNTDNVVCRLYDTSIKCEFEVDDSSPEQSFDVDIVFTCHGSTGVDLCAVALIVSHNATMPPTPPAIKISWIFYVVNDVVTLLLRKAVTKCLLRFISGAGE